MTDRPPANPIPRNVRLIVAAAELLRTAGWTCHPPPDPKAPCGHCGRPWNYHGGCHMGGCPLGADR